MSRLYVFFDSICFCRLQIASCVCINIEHKRKPNTGDWALCQKYPTRAPLIVFLVFVNGHGQWMIHSCEQHDVCCMNIWNMLVFSGSLYVYAEERCDFSCCVVCENVCDFVVGWTTDQSWQVPVRRIKKHCATSSNYSAMTTDRNIYTHTVNVENYETEFETFVVGKLCGCNLQFYLRLQYSLF